MDFTLLHAPENYKAVIENMMQFYIYDFSVYVDYDVDENGLFKPYSNLGDYWSDRDNKFPYLFIKAGMYAGFALVSKLKSNTDLFSITEFFVMKKYRRSGIGRAAALQLFEIHNGEWQVHQRENNQPAYEFWKNVIAEYTTGDYCERVENGRIIQNFRSR
jgi:predicted acetyltransferase